MKSIRLWGTLIGAAALVAVGFLGAQLLDRAQQPSITMNSDTVAAEVRAGVDLAQAAVDIDGTDVSVSLPAATVQSISIDPDSLQFYDQQYALLNWQNRDDTAKALQMAQDDAQAKVDSTAMLEDAQKQAETVVEALLLPFTENGDYTVRVTFAEAPAPETSEQSA